MKTLIISVSLVLALTVFAGALPNDKTSSGMDKLKQLVGTWKGTDGSGKPVTVSYQLVSKGTSLMETLGRSDEKDVMVTMYYPDKNTVMMTHYCSVGNQPRMRLSSESKDPGRLVFNYLDATNLKSKNDPHMNKLIVTLKNNDHFTQEWFFLDNGKVTSDVFSYERVK